MIDREAEVYNAVVASIRTVYPGIFCTSEYVAQPPSFPAVSLMQMDNPILPRAREFINIEMATRPMFELNVYSNKTTGKKSECKEIAAAANDALVALGFTRTMLEPIPNMADATIYRMVGRYTKIVS